MSTAPIVLFAYKRPGHTLATLEALAACELADQSRLTIYCDGPKTPEDRALTDEVQAVARSRQWCAEVEVVAREQNRGLAASVIAGVTEMCNEYGRVIVLEDDLIVAPNFLRYMNDALDRYVDEPRVMQVSGHMFDAALDIDADALFMPFVTTWGWATWSRAWAHFDPAMSGYDKLADDAKRRRRFNLDGAYNYFDMLERQRAGVIDSWGIRWNLSVFEKDGLVLYPKRSLVDNRGFDGSGTHCGVADNSDAGNLRGHDVVVFPKTVGLDQDYSPVLTYLVGGSRYKRFAKAVLTRLGLR
jgi:hypothetical protein